MKLEPQEAAYLRTIVKSQVMTEGARARLLDLIDGAEAKDDERGQWTPNEDGDR